MTNTEQAIEFIDNDERHGFCTQYGVEADRIIKALLEENKALRADNDRLRGALLKAMSKMYDGQSPAIKEAHGILEQALKGESE